MSTTTGTIPAVRTARTRPATPSRRVAIRPIPAPVARPGSAPTSAAPTAPGADRISEAGGREAGIRRDPLRIAARLSPLLGVLFFASDASSFCSGQTLYMHGGPGPAGV